MSYMKRIVNIRFPVLTACFLALGVWVGYLFSYHQADFIWLIAVLPVSAILFIVSFICKKKLFAVFSVLLALFFAIGAINSFYRLENFKAREISDNEIYNVTGTVEEKGLNTRGEYIVLKNTKANGHKLNGKIKVFLPEIYGDFCDEGYTVSFTGKLNFNDAFAYGELNYYAEQNIKYTTSPNGLISSVYHYSLFGSIRTEIKNALYGNLSYDTAAICYGMLLGDTQHVDDEALANFRYGGIAHIFAVSGLHIGIIYSLLTFILKKAKCNKYLSAGLRISAIIFYSGICGFTLSSIRAVIMCAISMLTGLFHVKNDRLNNLSFAVILILLISPLSLFSVGFLLSVCAVGGIILLSKSTVRFAKKLKIPEIVSSPIGATFGAQAGTLPIMMAKFGYISGAGLIINLLIMVLISPLFTLTFAGTLLSVLIPPAAQFIMPYSVLPLETTLSFLLDANFENALITGFGSGVFIPLYYAVLLLLSDKLNLKGIPRSVFAGIGATALAACVLLLTYSPAKGYKISIGASATGGNVIIKSGGGNVLIMTQGANISRVKNFINTEYSFSLDGVIILGDDYSIESFDLSLPCKDLYLCSLYLPVYPFGDSCEVHYEHNFTLCGIDFEFADGHSILFNLDGVTVGVCESGKIPFDKCDLLISLQENYDKFTDSVQCDAETTVYFNLKDTKYNVYDLGTIRFYSQDGELELC